MSRRTAVVIAASALSLSTIPAAAMSANASAAPGLRSAAASASCDKYVEVPSHKVTSYHKTVAVTHASQIEIGPGASESTTTTADEVHSITASTSQSGGGSISAGWVFAKVQAHYGVKVGHTGQHTVEKSVAITWSVTNSSKGNREYVAFRGTSSLHGGFSIKNCVGQTPHKYGHWVTTTGTWKTFSDENASGIVWCHKSKHATALEKAAIKYC